jgi:predicted ArsR family transcriptional regulator
VSFPTETSDGAILSLLKSEGPLGIARLASATHVTATAVRQRLNRLMAKGFVDREVARAGRGRPSHRYLLTEKGERQAGDNFADLAMILWQEIRSIPDPSVRRGLLERIASGVAAMYRDRVRGETAPERMRSVSQIFAERNVPMSVEDRGGLTVLTAHECPYPKLAEQDRGICAAERMLFSQLLNTDVRLTECRLDGDTCCRFETK